MQDAGCRMQGAGCRVQSAGCRIQGAECWEVGKRHSPCFLESERAGVPLQGEARRGSKKERDLGGRVLRVPEALL